MMRSRLDAQTSREEAAKKIQAAYRGRKAREHVTRQKQAVQLRARAAAAKLLRAVFKHRSRLKASADQRPLLLRPDSTFITIWKLGVMIMVVLDVAQTLLAPAEGSKLSHEELLATLTMGDECLPKMIHGQRFGGIGPRTLVRAPLPSHCGGGLEGNYLMSLLGSALRQGVATLLGYIVAITASCDVLVEFFIGKINEVTGVLEPKPRAERYFLPPFSLCFNILVNPALGGANAMLIALLGCGNLFVVFRLVVCLQPVVQHAEEWVAPRLRAIFRAHQAFFGRQAQRSATLTKLPPHLMAAKSASMFDQGKVR